MHNLMLLLYNTSDFTVVSNIYFANSIFILT